MTSRGKVLLTGATGFVGQRVHPVLLDAGFEVVGGTRGPVRAERRFPERRYRYFEAHDPSSIEPALRGVRAAVYLIHGMGSRDQDYEHGEARAAVNFLAAAEKNGVERIVYLGSMQPRGAVSKHIRSRLATGETLRSGRVSTVELRAGMIIGGGSQSWRIVRDLAARLPLMALPRWLNSKTEPIGVDDVVQAILHATTVPIPGSNAFDLPGPEQLPTREVLRRTARLLGHDPFMFNVPLVTPRLSSHWIRLVTRANPSIASELVQGLMSDLVAHDDGYWRLMPDHQRMPFDQAARAALAEERATLSRRMRIAEGLVRKVAFSRVARGSGHPG